MPGPVPFPADLPDGLDEPAMADLTRPIKPRSHDCSHAGISDERLARRSYAPCPRFWRLLFDPWSFGDTRRLANPEVSDGDVTAHSDDADQSIRSDADRFGGKQRRAFSV